MALDLGLKKELEETYYLLPRNRFYAFLGGSFAFLVVAGMLSYGAAKAAIEASAAQVVIKQIKEMRDYSISLVSSIEEKEQIAKDIISMAEANLAILRQRNEIFSNLQSGIDTAQAAANTGIAKADAAQRAVETGIAQVKSNINSVAGSISGRKVSCRVFDDSAQSQTRLSNAVYVNNLNRVCIPGGPPEGECRRWFGLCEVE